MKSAQYYFKIGLFVLTSLVVVLGLIIVIGGTHLFSKTMYVETYFNESVQGLTEGSYVKYRGINIGRVKKIRFAQQEYPQASNHIKSSRYIYVLLAINSSFLTDIPKSTFKQDVAKQVHKGLRARLNVQDLTGSAYIQLTYLDKSDTTKTLPIYWQPEYAYIPSTPSTFSRLTDSVQNILKGLQGVDFQRFFKEGQSAMKNTSELVQHLNDQLGNDQNQITGILHNLNATSQQMRHLVNDMRHAPAGTMLRKPQSMPPRASSPN